ncbi:hypothetical protein ACMFMG_004404 [Clarireedia jacksonii]
MDRDPVQLSQERAVSSEPCSTRPHPSDDNEHSARKRQRTSRRDSRSRSANVIMPPEIPFDPMSPREETMQDQSEPLLPSTPTRPATAKSQAEPTSSRVTINLRTPHPPLDLLPSTPPSPSTPSKMMNSVEDDPVGIGAETESDALSTLPAAETPSSSPSVMGSPEIELVADHTHESEYLTRSPPLAIIGEDDVFVDPMATFPYHTHGETLLNTVRKIANFLQNDPIENEDSFFRLRLWIVNYLLYTEEREELFHELFIKHKDFWCAFPQLVWALSWRSRWFGDFMHRHNSECLSLAELLFQFAKLTGRFLLMDVKTLSYIGNVDQEKIPELASPHFLPAFSYLFKQDESVHIGRNLDIHYHWKWEEDTSALMEYFEEGGGSIPALTNFVEGQLKFITQQPKNIETLSEPSRLAEKLHKEAALRLRYSQSVSHHDVDEAPRKIIQGYDYFNVMSHGLESIIEKHVTSLAPDAATAHLVSLSSILTHTLAVSPRTAKDLVDRQKSSHPDIPESLFSKIIPMEWKFSILKKLIVSAQMQLRVIGVTTMCQDLLSIYSSYRPKDGSSISPVLLYFADFVLRNKLVDYIVGRGSHPELINESNNIVGFLVVTKTYTTAHTDTIWQTVMTSQDPRVVEAIIGMIRRCLNLFDYQSLIYLCQKVAALPIEAFTVVMRGFVESLLKELVTKSNLEVVMAPSPVDAPPYDLCVRLIRESSITSTDNPEGLPEIQNFAVGRLRELLVHGPDAQARDNIYLSCIEDISAKTLTAPGSICVIKELIRHNMATDMNMLTTKYGLTRLIIDEFESALSSSRSLTSSNPASIARREILILIITNEADTITSELGSRLWSLLVGAQAKDAAHRQAGWQILNSAALKATLKNRYLSTCFQTHLPKLQPSFFTSGTLDFVRNAVLSWLSETAHDFVEEDRAFESPALEQLWRIILNAPSKTVDAAAITLLVEVYIDSNLILSLPRMNARKIHLALIDDCMKKLAAAAAKLKSFSDDTSGGEDEEMVIIPSETQIRGQEIVFTRSLAVLREFLKAYQSKPQFATPKLRTPVTLSSDTVQGEPLTVMYQSFDGDKHTEVKTFTMGKLNTAASLLASLRKATGFTHYKVFYGGKEFNPDEVEMCKSLEDLNLNGLVLVQRREDGDGLDGNVSGITGSLELEITKRFDEIWSYLGMQDKLASEIYYFLIQFPVYDKILEDLSDTEIPYKQIFPLGQPYKALYALYVLREYVSTHSLKGSVDEAIFDRAMTLLVAAISDPDVLDRCATEDVRHCLAMNLVSSFASLLKEPLLPQSSIALLDVKLLDRLLQLLGTAKSVTTTTNSVHLTWNSFEALLEAAIQSSALWNNFLAHLQATALLRELVLDDPRSIIRKSVVKHISSKCTFSPNSTRVSTLEITATLWPIVSRLIPAAASNRQQCEETFALALTLLKRLTDTTLNIDLNAIIRQWGSLLATHETVEEVGQPESVDMVAQGLTNLLYYAVSIADASEQILSGGDLGPQLFQKHLFPDLSDEPHRENELVAPRIPLLNTITRHSMCETIFNLIKDDDIRYKDVLQLLYNIVPYDPTYENPYAWDLSAGYERSKAIRSSTGYVGLRNLSNTCYLNSLVTQLFMNVSFREFMFQAHVADGGSQKLLSETQLLFAYMQNSVRRYVDPTNFANTIRTFDDAQIDVTIQMDVDEFYNLLFDRWERQILAPDAKRKFRSFYGGQLVQQVKSKECPHISERMEEFSAIQCDIKGKSSLQESLQAYVDGEVMEGDNKYKCSTCDRHVDAVKRACLKDIPDNLIFHLKRFDFNLRTLQRSKINDYFKFPSKIDMRPYKVEHLMDEDGGAGEDMFELVGVLVHSGTAESGHYYSFIRERPSASETPTWVEYNDDSVTPWDATSMEANCFGGVDVRGTIDASNMQYEKNYSAYMLFYQRSSELEASQEALRKSKAASPVKLPILPQHSAHLAMENELLMRKYCLYDPSHPGFVMKMIHNMKRLNNGTCSESHELEKQVMHVALSHLDQVVSRTKDIPDAPNFIMTLRQQCQACAECSRDFLEYFCECTDSLRFLLMKCPEVFIRTEIATSIVGALVKVRSDAPYAYGLEKSGDDDSIIDVDCPRVLQRVVMALNQLYEVFHTCLKAWPEYFGLLSSIANLGDNEAAVLLDAGFLIKTMDIITADPMLNIGTQLTRMLALVSKRSATRPVSYDCVIGLLYKLLHAGGVTNVDAVEEHESRLAMSLEGLELALTIPERDRLLQRWTRTNSHILTEKLLQINQNQYATRMIIMILLHYSNNIDGNIFSAILHGIRRNTSSLSGPFLRAALVYCEHSEAERAIPNMIANVAKSAGHVENAEGREYLRFFKDFISLPSNYHDVEHDDLIRLCLNTIPTWAPALLTYYESTVRADTEDFLNELVFNHGTDSDSPSSPSSSPNEDLITTVAQRLANSCLEYLHEVYIRQRQQAVRTVLVNIQNIIEQCVPYFGSDETSPQKAQFRDKMDAVLPALRKYMVEEADEDVSDWEASDGEYGSSEPMDSITELCGPMDNELETQL